MKRVFCVSLLCSACLLAAPEDGTFVAPRLGYLFETGPQTFRPIDGVPGASLLGLALDPGFAIADAVVSPDQSYALAITADSRSACVLAFSGGAWTRLEIPGADYPLDGLTLSPSGASAVLYSASAGVVQVISGMPKTPVVHRTLRLQRLDRMAVSDDGTLVLVSAGDPSSPVLVFGDGERPRAVPILGPASAMIFGPQSHDALIAAAGGVTLIREVGTGSEYQLFPEKPGHCVALGFSGRGDRFFAAYDDGTIASHDLAAGGSSTLDCRCVPTVLQQMNADSVFRLTGGDKGPILLLDGTNNRVLFVAREDQGQ